MKIGIALFATFLFLAVVSLLIMAIFGTYVFDKETTIYVSLIGVGVQFLLYLIYESRK